MWCPFTPLGLVSQGGFGVVCQGNFVRDGHDGTLSAGFAEQRRIHGKFISTWMKGLKTEKSLRRQRVDGETSRVLIG